MNKLDLSILHWVKFFNKGLDKDDQKEFDDKDDKYKKKQQNNKLDTKPPNTFNYLKSLSQNAKYFLDKIEDADDDIDDGKLLFIGSNIENLTLPLLGSH